MSECRTRSGIVPEDEVLTIFIPGFNLIPSGVHPEDACRVCRCCAMRCIHNCRSGPQTISQKHSRRLCERHSALHRGQTEPHPRGGARHPPCSLPLRWNCSSLRGRVDTAGRMGGSVHVLAFDHLARGRGGGKHSRLCEAKQALSTFGKTGCTALPDAHVISVSAVEPGCC